MYITDLGPYTASGLELLDTEEEMVSDSTEYLLFDE
jgi:hypothetical protein